MKFNACLINFILRIKNQLDATYYFIALLIGSTCFGHYYAHHQEFRDCVVDYHISRFVLGLLNVGGYVRLGWSSVRDAGLSTVVL